MNWQPNHPAFQTLLATIQQETTPVYAVGGVVRDHLLGRDKQIADLDLVVTQPALSIAQRVADRLGWAFYALDERRDLARLVFTANQGIPLVCDISRMRGGTLEADLLSRYFTLNAMAFLLHPNSTVQLIDLHQGQRDLQQKTLRQVTAMSMPDDPIRMLRAIRLAQQFQLRIDDPTRIRIQECASIIRLSSPDRVRDELWKMMATSRPDWAVDEMHHLGLLPYVLPEIAATIDIAQTSPHYLDVYNHTRLTMHHAAQLREWLTASPWRSDSRTEVASETASETASEMAQIQDTHNLIQHAWQKMLSPWRVQLHHYFTQITASGRQRADWLVWYALLHDIGKPKTHICEIQPDGTKRIRFYEHEDVGAELSTERLTYLNFSRQEINRAGKIIQAHMRPHHLHNSFRSTPKNRGISRRAIYRFVRDLEGDKAAPISETLSPCVDTALLAWADYQSIHARLLMTDWEGYLAHINQLLSFVFEDQGPKDARRRPIIDGHALMKHLDLSPGPIIGQLLTEVLEGQVAGTVNTKENALEFAETALELLKTHSDGVAR